MPKVEAIFCAVAEQTGGSSDTAEDAYAIRRGEDGIFRAAIADGASDGIFSRFWAEILTQAWLPERTASLPPLEPLRQRWREKAAEKPLPWNMAARLAQGAAAAFLGVAISPDGVWQAVAVGDCLLAHLRQDKSLALSFPFTSVNDFPDLPLLLHTDPVRSAETQKWTMKGTLEEGDELLLMTDALAHWYLQETGRGEKPGVWFEKISPPETFAHRLRHLRTSQRLRDDDATLVRLRYSP